VAADLWHRSPLLMVASAVRLPVRAHRDPRSDVFCEDFRGAQAIPCVPRPALVRLKMLRDGMEDYEYLRILGRLSATSAASVVRGLFGNPQAGGAVQTNRANVTSAALEAARNQIASLVEQLMNPTNVIECPPEKPEDCCGDASICMSIPRKCEFVICR
jgi:hypothetical protein